MVGVSGFEPEASWTRTKRDTKLRHTPIAILLYSESIAVSSEILMEWVLFAYNLIGKGGIPVKRKKIATYFMAVLSTGYLIGSIWLLMSVCGHCFPQTQARIKAAIGGLEGSAVRDAFATLADGLQAGLPVSDTVEASAEVLFGWED